MDISLSAIFIAGLLTFLSPCVLPLIPIYLSLFAKDSEKGSSALQTFFSSLSFTIGFTLIFTLMGATATAIGQWFASNRVLFQQIGGVIILLLGLRFMGYLNISFLDSLTVRRPTFTTKLHYLNSFILGLFFSFAWTPCIGSVLGAVLTYTALKTTDPLVGMSYLAIYAIGFASPLLILSLFAGKSISFLARMRNFIPIFEKVTGFLLIIVGFLITTDRVGILNYVLTRPPEKSSLALQVEHPNTLSSEEGMQCKAEEGVCSASLNRPQMIEFYSPSCPICLQMIPTMNLIRQTCQTKAVEITQINIETPEGRSMARKFGITGIPVFVFIDKDGKEVARLVGYQNIETLTHTISILIGEECPVYREMELLQNNTKDL